MPDKEGSDDEKKSTKSVVKKKQKQFMNQEELDLTKIAEAFGGYVVEANGKKDKDERSRAIDRFIKADDPFNPPSEEEAAKQQAKKEIQKSGGTQSDRIGGQGSGKFKEPVSGTPKAKGYKPKGKIKLGDTTKGGPVKTTYMNKADAAAAAASDALDDIASDRKVMGRPTPSVKRGVKQTVQKPLQDKVQAQKDRLDKKIQARSTGKTRSIPRVPGASGEKPTGSIARGTYKSSPAGEDAYKLKKSDLEAQQGIKDAGGTGDIGYNAPNRKEKVKKRTDRAERQGTPDPFDGKKTFKQFQQTSKGKAIADIRASDKRLYDTGLFPEKKPSLVQQRKAAEKQFRSGERETKRGDTSRVQGRFRDKTFSQRFNPDQRARMYSDAGMYGDSNPTQGGAGGRTVTTDVRKKVDKDIEDKIKSVTPQVVTDFPTGKLKQTTDAVGQAAKSKRMRDAVLKGVSKRIPGVGSAAAGAEAGLQAMKGDLGRAARTAAETLPVVGPAFTVANVMRDMKDAELARKGTIVKYKEPTGMKKRIEKLPMRGKMALGGAVAGATALSPMMLRRGAKKVNDVRRALFPSIRGGTVGRRSAKT